MRSSNVTTLCLILDESIYLLIPFMHTLVVCSTSDFKNCYISSEKLKSINKKWNNIEACLHLTCLQVEVFCHLIKLNPTNWNRGLLTL